MAESPRSRKWPMPHRKRRLDAVRRYRSIRLAFRAKNTAAMKLEKKTGAAASATPSLRRRGASTTTSLSREINYSAAQHRKGAASTRVCFLGVASEAEAKHQARLEYLQSQGLGTDAATAGKPGRAAAKGPRTEVAKLQARIRELENLSGGGAPDMHE